MLLGTMYIFLLQVHPTPPTQLLHCHYIGEILSTNTDSIIVFCNRMMLLNRMNSIWNDGTEGGIRSILA